MPAVLYDRPRTKYGNRPTLYAGRTYASKLANAGRGVTAWQSIPHDTLVTTETLTVGGLLSKKPRSGKYSAVKVQARPRPASAAS